MSVQHMNAITTVWPAYAPQNVQFRLSHAWHTIGERKDTRVSDVHLMLKFRSGFQTRTSPVAAGTWEISLCAMAGAWTMWTGMELMSTYCLILCLSPLKSFLKQIRRLNLTFLHVSTCQVSLVSESYGMIYNYYVWIVFKKSLCVCMYVYVI